MSAVRIARAIALAALPALGACVTGRTALDAPPGVLVEPAAAQQDAFGGWVAVELVAGAGRTHIAGELIATSRDTIWVLAADGAHAIAAPRVQRASVTGYDSQAGAVGRAAAIGAIATLSHGIFLVFTAPAWIATGAFGSRAQAREPVRTAGPHDLPALASFARFPQGMPPGLALDTLRWRP